MDARRNLLFNASLQMLLVVAIVGLANAWSSTHFARLDLTRDRLFSLDEASKGIAAKLDRPLVVKAYFTRGLQAPYNNHEQLVRDKLEEFSAYSGGRLKITVVDPATDDDLVGEARQYGLQELEYTVREADRSELRKIWMGAVLLYGDRQEVLPSLTDLSTLEYELASAMHRLQLKADDVRTIGWTTGHGEPDLARAEGPLKGLLESIAKKASIRTVPLGGAGTIPEDIDALLIVGPQKPLEDRALYQVDQFVMRGGATAFFVTNTRPDLRNYRAVKVTSGLEPLLGHYGVKVNRDLVVDRVQNGLMRFPIRVGKAAGYREINYPLLPKATDLEHDAVMIGGLDALLFPFTSTLEPAEQLQPGVRAEILARSSAASGAIPAIKTVDPTQLGNLLPDERRGPFPVLVALTGAQRSFFETRPVPPPIDELPAVVDEENPEEAPLTVEGASARLLVAGSADFVANNTAFMLNLVDWLTQDEALVGIRSKIATIPTLQSTTPSERAAWKAFVLLTGPALLFAYGALRQLRYRRLARAAAARTEAA